MIHQEPHEGTVSSRKGRCVLPRTIQLCLAAVGGAVLLFFGASHFATFHQEQDITSSPLLRQKTVNVAPLQTRLTAHKDEFLPRARSLNMDFNEEEEEELEGEEAFERELAKNKKKNKAKKKKKKTRKKPKKIYPAKSSKSASATLAPTKSRAPSASPTASYAPSASPSVSAAPTTTPGPTTPPTSSPTKSSAPSASPAPSLSIAEQNERVTCISIIDENDSYVPTSLWNTFRANHPNRPMCLLQPVPPGTSSTLGIPSAFYSEGMNFYQKVTRNSADVTDTSDWYDICNMDESRSNGLTNVVLFVDNSGSMHTSDVQNAHDLFIQRMAAKGMTIVSGVYNGYEDYISPCNDLTLT